MTWNYSGIRVTTQWLQQPRPTIPTSISSKQGRRPPNPLVQGEEAWTTVPVGVLRTQFECAPDHGSSYWAVRRGERGR
jgi:hypothetical protein